MKKLILTLTIVLMSFQVEAEKTIEDIEKEISFLAKELLEITGKDKYVLELKGTSESMVGACFEVKTKGIKLTCITPNLDPQKKGMVTGDFITKINDISFINEDIKASNENFIQIMKKKKVGDVLEIQYINKEKKVINVDIVVGQFTFPSFKFEVTK